MKKYIIVILIILFILNGCSATNLNDTLLNNINSEEKVMQPEDQVDLGTVVEDEIKSESTTEEKEDEADIDPDLKRIDNMNVTIKGVGDSYQGFVKYDEKLYDGTIERKIRGTEGVYYTLTSVNIYESIEESGIELNKTILDNEGNIDKFVKSKDEIADFIVVEMSAVYDKPAGGEDKVIVYTTSDLSPAFFEDNLKEGFYDRIHSGEINNNPVYAWFDVDEAHRVKIDNDKGKNLFNFYISEGEVVNFKIGIFTPRELIETDNIYLCINKFVRGFLRNYTHKYFALLPEE